MNSMIKKFSFLLSKSPIRFCPKRFGAASPQDFKTAKEPGKTIGSNHVLTERRKEKFLIQESITFKFLR